MKKQKNEKFSFEKFEMAKLKNKKRIVGGSELELTIDSKTADADNDTNNPIKPITTI